MKWKTRIGWALFALLVLATATAAKAAGTLTPVGSPNAPIEIGDHHVRVVINNGFAHTEVTQTFTNPNAVDLEGVYAFPVPVSASLSEVTITTGERRIDGEVVEKERARRIYEEEKSRGNDAGLASKNGYKSFEFRVSPIRARAETSMRFVYYQPLEIDTGVGRYLYPLEAGGTDDVAKSFWSPNEKVNGFFSVDLELKSSWPVDDVRVPGYEGEAVVDRRGEGDYHVQLERQGASLDRDFVFYYRLADGLPGRVELLPYRADANEPGSFMLVVTPGLDLQPITGGADHVFVLDVSGSMSSKIATLGRGVGQALGELDPNDRFRIVTFNDRDDEITRGWTPATPENVQHWAKQAEQLGSGGSTNLYAGLSRAFSDLDADRATSVILVTDAVTNTGVVNPVEFHALMKRHDVRLFGFLMGNSGNWPLMRLVTEASGGFYAQISNADDILGQILLAKSKVTHEALHDAELEISGVGTSEVTGAVAGKVYRGEQLVLFGRYDGEGQAKLALRARLTGQDRTYTTSFRFPEVDTDHPEIERLWALSRIEEFETLADTGLLDPAESAAAIRGLGVDYQLVTDETSMIVLDDASFARHQIERHNQARTAIEHAAQQRRAAATPAPTQSAADPQVAKQQPVRDRRVDRKKPMFKLPAPSVGGGAIDPLSGALAMALGALGLAACRSGVGRS